MKLAVRLSTELRFDTPQREVMLSHRLRPGDSNAQSVIDWSVELPGGVFGAAFRDGAGDQIGTVSLYGPVEAVTITAIGRVETTDRAGILAGHREKVPAAAYLRTTRFTRPDKALLDLGHRALEEKPYGSMLDRAHALAAALHDAVQFDTDETEDGAPMSASDTLAAGQAGCLSQAHALVAMAIAQDIPARIVRGFAHEEHPEGDREPLHLDGARPHGWAELHVGKLGWVGFDPANACCPDDRYVRLCSGFDAADADPLRMVASGVSESDTEIAVELAAAGQSQIQQ